MFHKHKKSKHDAEMVIVLFGSERTGKTSLLRRLVDDKYQEDYVATNGVNFRFNEVKNGQGYLVKQKIWDTSGQELFKAAVLPYLKVATVIMLTIDISEPVDVGTIQEWMADIEAHATRGCRVYVVANKSDGERLYLNDLKSFMDTASRDGVIQDLFACSAKNKSGVKSLFQTAANLIEGPHQQLPGVKWPKAKSLDADAGFKWQWPNEASDDMDFSLLEIEEDSSDSTSSCRGCFGGKFF